MELKSTKNITPHNTQTANLSETERWNSLITESSLVLTALGKSSLRSVLQAIAGNSTTETAKKDQSLPDLLIEATGLNKGIRVEKTVTIQNKSPEELYNFWHNFENLPKFMKHLKSVTVINNTRSHWVASAPLGNSVEWDAEILTDIENKLITWVSVEDADVDNSGFVRFKSAFPGRGTQVKVVIEYNLPGGGVTNAIAKLFGEAPEQQVGDALRYFKMLMETGEIATTEGQSSGER